MQIGSIEWRQLIVDGARDFDLKIDLIQTRMFTHHAELLMEWNRKTNLTAITDPWEVAIKHFLDSVAPISVIAPHATVLDIGSGAGFPGIPLKILMPSLRMMLIDASRKKVSFLKHVIRSLKLETIEAHHLRAEDLVKQRSAADGFDVIVSRALSSMEDYVTLAAPLLAAGGAIMAMKGPDYKKNVSETVQSGEKTDRLIIGNDEYALAIKKYTLPFTGSQRAIIILKNV